MRITINPDVETCDHCNQNTDCGKEIMFFGEWMMVCESCKKELEGEE